MPRPLGHGETTAGTLTRSRGSGSFKAPPAWRAEMVIERKCRAHGVIGPSILACAVAQSTTGGRKNQEAGVCGGKMARY